MKKYISRTTSRLYNAALISLMIAFTAIYTYLDNKASEFALIIAFPALIAGIYFLTTAYHRSKKEL